MTPSQLAKLLDRVDNLARQNPTLRWDSAFLMSLMSISP